MMRLSVRVFWNNQRATTARTGESLQLIPLETIELLPCGRWPGDAKNTDFDCCQTSTNIVAGIHLADIRETFVIQFAFACTHAQIALDPSVRNKKRIPRKRIVQARAQIVAYKFGYIREEIALNSKGQRK